MQKQPKNLLAIDTNAKTIKGQSVGFLTGILYMAPNTVAGRGTVCPLAVIAECDKACLYTAGRGGFSNVQLARINKTNYFFDAPELFMNTLVRNIAQLKKKAARKDLIPVVRLNGTSDIMWEMKDFNVNDETSYYLKRYHGLDVSGHYDNIMSVFPDVQFYDYTKIAIRFDNTLPANYDLTFSYSGVIGYQKSVKHAISMGARIAVVFRNDNFPTQWMGMPVVNGDATDVRHIDPQGCIVALKAKGGAKKDTSGFVVDIA